MVTGSFFSHVPPDGTQLVDRLNAARYTLPASGGWAAGENLAWGAGALSTADGLVAGWMASPSHRANVLSRDFRDVGVGVVLGSPSDRDTGVTVTTEFGVRASLTGQPTEPPNELNRTGARRKTCGPGHRRRVARYRTSKRGAERCGGQVVRGLGGAVRRSGSRSGSVTSG
jgi:hypothetical protein